MKIYLALIILFLYFTTSTFTQGSLYLDLGYNHSSLNTNSFSPSFKSGYYTGLYFTELYKNNVEFSSGLRYSELGVGAVTGNRNFNFLEGLASLGYRVQPDLTLQGGFSLGRLLNKKTIIQRDFDFGMIVGVKYNFPHVIFKAQYYRGLLNQTPNISTSTYTENIQLGLGFRLTSTKKPIPNDTIIVFKTIENRDTSDTVMTVDSLGPYYRKYVGFTFNSFDKFDFLYKKSLSRNIFLRVGLVSSYFSFAPGDDNQSDGSLAMNIGLEWMKNIDDRTYFVHGPSLFGSSNFLQKSELKLGLRYTIGYYHRLSERFDVGGELSPQISYTNINQEDLIELDLTTEVIKLVVVYKLDLR